jgi:hypothetical protein
MPACRLIPRLQSRVGRWRMSVRSAARPWMRTAHRRPDKRPVQHLLEAEGLVSRHYEPTVPPRVTYSLTGRVMEPEPVMGELVRI